MARVVAERIVEYLGRSGFVIMQKTPPVGGAAPLGRGFEKRTMRSIDRRIAQVGRRSGVDGLRNNPSNARPTRRIDELRRAQKETVRAEHWHQRQYCGGRVIKQPARRFPPHTCRAGYRQESRASSSHPWGAMYPHCLFSKQHILYFTNSQCRLLPLRGKEQR